MYMYMYLEIITLLIINAITIHWGFHVLSFKFEIFFLFISSYIKVGCNLMVIGKILTHCL